MNNDTTIRTDCFAYKKGNCTALDKLYCTKEKCTFYKTSKELLAQQLQLEKRNKQKGLLL